MELSWPAGPELAPGRSVVRAASQKENFCCAVSHGRAHLPLPPPPDVLRPRFCVLVRAMAHTRHAARAALFTASVVLTAAAAAVLPPAAAAQTADPFPTPLAETATVIRVDYREFAVLPDIDGEPARPMLLLTEPGGHRLFVNDMRGPLYSIHAGFPLGTDGRVTEYLNIDDERWGLRVESGNRERGFQSFAFHPDFSVRGARGYGRFYTWSDVVDTIPAPDYTPGGGNNTHDTMLLEWTARTPGAAVYDGGPPRALLRIEQPYGNHNGGQLAFNPLTRPGDADHGMLYIGNADGGSGGDPLNLAQDLGSVFGKVLRIDPLGTDAPNGRYGIPADNPFVGRAGARGEVWALGVRNPQRFGWDAVTGILYVADIGQNVVEELSPVPRGGNLGWNVWEGSYRYLGRAGVLLDSVRADPAMVYPIAEYDHNDPLVVGRSATTGVGRAAVTGVVVYRSRQVPQLTGRILFGDLASGEIFHVPADDPPAGGQAAIGRVLLNDGGAARTLLELIRAKNTAQRREPATRTDLRFGTGPTGEVFLLNKQDGVIRLIVPGG
jgi:hypothetical protein